MASTSKSETEPDILQIECDSEFESESEEGQVEREDDEGSVTKFTESDIVDVMNKAMQPFLNKMEKISKKVDKLEKTAKKRKYEDRSSSEDDEEEEEDEENEKRFKTNDPSNEDIGMFEGEEEVTEEIETRIAEFIQVRYMKNMKAKNLGDLADKYPPPANLKHVLKSPKVNAEVWKNLTTNAKSKDIMFGKAQNLLSKAGVAFTKVLEQSSDEKKQILKDGMTMLAQAFRQVSYLRRDRLRFGLPPELKQICEKETPLGEDLFGEDQDIKKKMKEVQENYKKSGEKKRTFLDKRPYFNKNRNQNQQRDRQANQYQGKKKSQSQKGRFNFFQKR